MRDLLLVKSALNDVSGSGKVSVGILAQEQCSKISFTAAYVDPLCMKARQKVYFLFLQAGSRFQFSE